MDISKHIINYLSDNTSVIVPGLGRFTAVNKPSEINGDIVTPPVKTVEYDSSRDEDDGVLTGYISSRENVDLEQVKAEMDAFYENIKIKLAAKKAIMLNKFGTLSVNSTGDIIFEPDPDLSLVRQDTYGLGEVSLQSDTTAETVKTNPDPVNISVPPPVIVSQPVPEQAGTSATAPDAQPPAATVEKESLFDTTNMRVRENTERRRPAYQKQEPPVKPVRPATKSQPASKKTEKKKPAKSSSGFPMWIVLVLVIAAGLAFGFYKFYPTLSPYIDSAISSISGKKKTDNSQKEPAGLAENTPNPEVAQSLDEATEKKNALNPETSSQTPVEQSTASSTSAPPAAETKPVTATAPKTESRPVAQNQGNFGSKKYLLIVGSFTTQTRAENFGKSLQNAGIAYEIIDFGNQKVRVAVAGYDDKTEAFNQANRFKTKPHCENVWVLKR